MEQSIHPPLSLPPEDHLDPARARRRRAAALVQSALFATAAMAGLLVLPTLAFKVFFVILAALAAVTVAMVPSGRFDDKLRR